MPFFFFFFELKKSVLYVCLCSFKLLHVEHFEMGMYGNIGAKWNKYGNLYLENKR